MVFTVGVSTQPGPGVATSTDGAGLVSGEAVELDVRVARAGSRVVALLLDILVQAGLLTVVLPIVLLVADTVLPFTDFALVRGLSIVCVVLVLVGYPVTFETLSGGRTLGKLALGLRVVRDDGGPIRFRHALTRSLVAVAVEWPGLVLPLFTWIASLVTMLAHPRGKRIGDLAAGTIVIHERTPAAWGWVPGMPPALAGWARTLDLTGLDDDLALAARHFLARGHGLVEPERSRLGHALATEIAAVTTPPVPPGAPGWAYLAAVLAERHRRAAHRLARARAASARLWPELSRPARAAPPRPPAAEPGAGGRPGQERAQWGMPADAPASPAPVPTIGAPMPSHAWPEPPWRTPGTEGPGEDWTGLRPPRVASALRPPPPRAD
jgi:uncharacterized RDD family membrane protein YckC